MSNRSTRPAFGRQSGSMNPVGVLVSLVVVVMIVLMFFAWMLRDLG